MADSLDSEWETLEYPFDEKTEDKSNSTAAKNPRSGLSLRRGISEEFTCGVCYELMVEPTTLQCGHSFCRHCLAAWFLNSNKTQCPSCRQQYIGLPKVSVTLRSTIQNFLSDKYEDRKESALTSEALADISKFEQAFSVASRGQNLRPGANINIRLNQRNLRDYKIWLGFAIIAGVTILIWTLLGGVYRLLFGSSKEMTMYKPIARWTEWETRRWLSELGPWAESALSEKFAEMNIDGSLLVAMTEEDLANITSDLDDLHFRAFFKARDDIMTHGFKPPGTFWEYKKEYLFKSTWALHFSIEYPRLTVLLLYLFDYTDGYLPLVHSTCPVLDMKEIHLATHKFPQPTWGQWLDFVFRWLLIPQLGIYANFMIRHVWRSNWFIALYSTLIYISCTFIDMCELAAILTTMNNLRIMLPQLMEKVKACLTHCCMFLVAWILWNFIPSLFINLFFYWTFIWSASKFKYVYNVAKEFRGL